MFRKILAIACLFSGVHMAAADEPSWTRQFGLKSLVTIDDAAGSQIRGAAFGVRSTSLAQVSGIIYDYRSGSRFNVDAVNYGAAIDGIDGMYEHAAAESAVISAVPTFEVTINHPDGGSFSAMLNAISYGAGKGLVQPQLPTGPYPQ